MVAAKACSTRRRGSARICSRSLRRSSRRRATSSVRESRPLDQLIEQFQGGPQPRRRHFDAGREDVPAGVDMEGGTEPLGGLDQLDARIAVRAFGHRPAARTVAPARSAGSSAAPRRKIRLAETSGRSGNVDRQDLQAGRQHGPLEAGEVVGARLARRRAVWPGSPRASCRSLLGLAPGGWLGGRHVGQHDSVVRTEDVGRDRLDLGRRDRAGSARAGG